MAERERHRHAELALVVRLADAHRGAEPSRLDEDGVRERVLDRIAVAQGDALRDRNAAVAQDGLENILVHAQRRGQHPGADVGHTGKLEQALDGAVLTEWPV